MPDRWQQRADDAMATLARERGKALTGYAFLLTGDLRDAEDLVQDALVKTFVRRRSGLELGSAEGYLRRTILTTYIDGYRRRTKVLTRASWTRSSASRRSPVSRNA